MLPKKLQLGLAAIATLIFGAFVFGLVQSIAVGFAGLGGALPVILITIFVFGMALFDIWDEIIKK
jgi:small basic protein